MVLKIEPIFNCIESIKKENKVDEIIYMSPDGEKLSQKNKQFSIIEREYYNFMRSL